MPREPRLVESAWKLSFYNLLRKIIQKCTKNCRDNVLVFCVGSMAFMRVVCAGEECVLVGGSRRRREARSICNVEQRQRRTLLRLLAHSESIVDFVLSQNVESVRNNSLTPLDGWDGRRRSGRADVAPGPATATTAASNFSARGIIIGQWQQPEWIVGPMETRPRWQSVDGFSAAAGSSW